jgi:plasmid stability protein
VRTLYIRNVPDDVAERLQRMAARRGVSLNALAVRELTEVAGRSDNYALLADLPSVDIPVEEIVAELERGRNER